MKAMTTHAKTDDKIVAVITAPKSIPQFDKTAGCTKIMYESAKNVVAPPIISRLIVEFLSEILNNLSKNNLFIFEKFFSGFFYTAAHIIFINNASNVKFIIAVIFNKFT